MATVGAGFSMSLDGFITGADDVGPLFNWYTSGDTAYTYPNGLQITPSAVSAKVMDGQRRSAGVIVTGRRLPDYTRGWRS
jgi:hypothetical protein